MPTIKINVEKYRELTADLCLHEAKDVAAHAGISEASLSRVLRGVNDPSTSFIARCLTVLPVRFEDLFHVVVDEPAASTAA